MNLLIVESPAKAKTLKKFLGKDFSITASYGHVIDLPKNEFGVDIEKGFEPKYTIIEGKEKILKKIKKEAKKAENIFLASDPDREGEAIAWHIANFIKLPEDKIKRALFHEITKNAVLEAVNNPTSIDLNKFNAQQARRILDRIVGYKVSPLLWKKIKRGLSAGRVQSVAVRLVCEREEEIKNFIPEEFWTIEATFKTEDGKILQLKLTKKNGKKIKISDKKTADEIVNELKKTEFIISKVAKKERKRYPLPPFITSSLQQEASNRLNFRPSKTMQIAQSLYEGVPLGEEGPVGLITYMRTDSFRLADVAINSCRKFIKENIGKEYLPAKSLIYTPKGKKIQDAHEAIRPTSIYRTPESIKQFLTKDQFKLYKLIWERFISCQMKPAIYEQTTVTVKAGVYEFSGTGSILKFDGFLKILSYLREKDKELPELEENQKLKLEKIASKQHFTEPPPRYTESTLVKALEEKGIGRPSTYAPTLSNIIERKYVEIKNKKLYPTELGMIVNKLLVENFPEIFNVNFTALMEENLDKIEMGKLYWKDILSQFYEKFKETLENAYKNIQHIKTVIEDSPFICEKCGSKMVVRWGEHGKFLACSNYPDCKNTKPLKIAKDGTLEIAEDEKSNVKCEKCGAYMVIKHGKYGKFLACSNYPKCKNTKPISLMKCPMPGCDGEIILRKTKKGRSFYGCTNFPDCKFATWYEPVNRMCPECGNPYLIKKSKYLQCPNSKCSFKEKL